VSITNNKVSEFPGIGIAVEAGTGAVGMLVSSSIAGNEVYDNGLDGIFIEGATSSGNSGISVVDNEAEGNHVFDCRDTSLATGPGYTLGTHNTWFNNIGRLSYPKGLCTPGRGHDRD